MKVASVVQFIEVIFIGCSPVPQVLLSEQIRLLRRGSVSGSDCSAEYQVMLREQIRGLT